MRIINQPESVTQGLDTERMEALEKMVSSIFQRLQGIEERIKGLEDAKQTVKQKPYEVAEMPKPIPVTAPEPVAPETVEPATTPMAFQGTLDAEAIRKGLLTKMWKYLNDKQAA